MQDIQWERFNGYVCILPSTGTLHIDLVDDKIHGEAKKSQWAMACSDGSPWPLTAA